VVAQKYLAFVEAQAKKDVDRRWAGIQAVAKELLIRRTLTGKEIFRLMSDKH
jgi:hypothetical protein